ncbi:alpha/beta hydrolase family protein [Nocardia nova SH22a]|uniref:Alpha/beta hydrolase family protein n=1 Tax=Nocardia nova SH22a TaxID=1415166 RepID=W5TNM4_9NOCA|nr:alpha/beta hydrolase [Nocardia nova]AHH20563.1 alpha/beta hydrolase family protein [Nocardia nova SH22a]
MRLKRFERDGIELTADIRDGDGPPLVMLPGVMADAATWRPVVDAITLPNPVVTINRRGRIPSGPLGANYTVRTEVDDLHHILDALGAEADLFGWSYGGLIALEAAGERSDLRSLTAYEPVCAPFAPAAIPALRTAIEQGDLDEAVRLVNTDVSGFSVEYVAALRQSPIWEVLRPLAAPLAEELAAIDGHTPDRERYRALKLPVTLLLGELNRGSEPYGTAFERIATALPRARVELLPGQGHLAHAGAPGLLADRIAAAVTAAVH